LTLHRHGPADIEVNLDEVERLAIYEPYAGVLRGMNVFLG
jgi:hypothetical protein